MADSVYDKLTALKSQIDMRKGRLDNIIKSLRDEFGADTVEEAEALLVTMEKRRVELDKEYQGIIKELDGIDWNAL